jgi:rod shape-determining protein MreC
MYRSQTRQRVALATLVAACITVITLDFRENEGGPIRRLQQVAVAVVAPLQEGVSKAFRGVGSIFSGIAEIGSLRKENARLEREIERLEANQRNYPEVERERDRLLGLMKEQPWNAGPSVDAVVTSRGLTNRERTVWISKGSAAGVREGMAVVAAEGLVGKVAFTSEEHAKILLMIDTHHSVGARLTGSSEVGVITGRGLDDPRCELIDPTTEVTHGEEVVTSGYDRGIFPPGIPVGRVDKVQQARDGLTQTATIRPFVDFSKLEFVRVLTSTGPAEDVKD